MNLLGEIGEQLSHQTFARLNWALNFSIYVNQAPP